MNKKIGAAVLTAALLTSQPAADKDSLMAAAQSVTPIVSVDYSEVADDKVIKKTGVWAKFLMRLGAITTGLAAFWLVVKKRLNIKQFIQDHGGFKFVLFTLIGLLLIAGAIYAYARLQPEQWQTARELISSLLVAVGLAALAGLAWQMGRLINRKKKPLKQING